MSKGVLVSYKLGATKMIPQVPAIQATLNIQRRILSSTIATYFQSSATWKKIESFSLTSIYCYFYDLYKFEGGSWMLRSSMTKKVRKKILDSCTQWLFRNGRSKKSLNCLIVSVLILDMLGDESDRIDGLLQMRLLFQLSRVTETAVKSERVQSTELSFRPKSLS